MKLLAGKKRKVAVLFPSGLGDSLLFIPLLKELKRKDFHITGIFYSAFDNDVFYHAPFVDKKVFIRSKASLLLYSLGRLRHFANYYINHLGNGSAIQLSARLCSRRVTRTLINGIHTAKRQRTPVPGLSDAEQNLHLLYSTLNSKISNISSFLLPPLPVAEKRVKPYFIIQVSAGNNTTPFKNWPMKNWVILIERFCKTYPGIDFLVLGDNTETGYIRELEKVSCSNCHILIGQTSIKQVMSITQNGLGYIGLDSGIMHIAVALQKKTLTIFGGSNEQLYGYEKIDPANHKIVKAGIHCRPCSGWKDANQTRVSDPMQCPDFACLHLISPEIVFDEAVAHFGL
ncbi:MAG TPA: glycosyltransferase family 9 protein [Ferruginibacter sp.]|nr:glycosyltransferase family 9 protein [Ferruginibacter sp.]